MLTLTALAAYRVTRLLVADSIADPWREQLFNRWPPSWERSRTRWVPEQQRHVYRADDDRVPVVRAAKLLDCPWCMGFWVCAAAVTIMRPRRPVLTTLALSTVVGMIGAVDGALE